MNSMLNLNFLKRKIIGKILIFVLLILAIITRFWHFGQPAEIVFDEVYFSRFSANYFTGEYYFDIHPPLAKLILAGSASLFGYSPQARFDFSTIGNEFTEEGKDFFYFLRFIISIFGVLLPLAMYFLARQMSLNRWASFLVGLLIVFDNAFLVQSRYILTDIFLLVFGVLGLAFFLRARKRGTSFWFYILSGLFLAASFSVKWTGLIFSGVVGLIFIYDFWKSKNRLVSLKNLILMVLTASLLYISIFAIHFKALPFSGTGDAFMGPSFKASLIGSSESMNESIVDSGFWSKFIELNITMYGANAGLSAEHSYGSKWHSWPIMERSIYYWNGEDIDGKMGKIYLLGNPIIWGISLGAMVFWFFWFLRQAIFKIFRKVELNKYFFPVAIILVGYIANLIAYIAVSRIAFIYHYLPSLIFAFLGVGLFIQKYGSRKYIYPICLLILIICGFLFFSPLSYGLPMDESSFDNRMWLDSWR